ncbi:hypothetical protein AKJ09_01844 [Labilithrix luteola]|uniref:Phasin domain-containing protein n=1 Tax=Labilithrix luteola TaxID=1391654 RepID=A0A0K1PNQ7_9BACT|nr:hypothetical protein [Labilithrix luteola]AKU95180.1 hypothetical protein AKJ09_01844 [Labilithrix luteola]
MLRRNMKVTPMSFNPFAQVGKVFETWQKLADDSVQRTASFYAEIEKAEAKNVERAESAVHEFVKLTKESLAYSTQLGAEWRKLSLESLQSATQAFSKAGEASR